MSRGPRTGKRQSCTQKAKPWRDGQREPSLSPRELGERGHWCHWEEDQAPGMQRRKISALLDQPIQGIVPQRTGGIALSGPNLHYTSDRDPTASLGGLFHILIDLIVRKLFIKLRILEVNEGTQAELLYAKSNSHMERVRLGKATEQYKWVQETFRFISGEGKGLGVWWRKAGRWV